MLVIIIIFNIITSLSLFLHRTKWIFKFLVGKNAYIACIQELSIVRLISKCPEPNPKYSKLGNMKNSVILSLQTHIQILLLLRGPYGQERFNKEEKLD